VVTDIVNVRKGNIYIECKIPRSCPGGKKLSFGLMAINNEQLKPDIRNLVFYV
jgi:hypothetical protein